MLEVIVLYSGVLLGAAISALSGFAFAPIAGAILLIAYPADVVIPLLMICSVTLQAFTLACLRAELSFNESRWLLLGGAIGVPISTALFSNIHSSLFNVAFGIFLILYALSMLLRTRITARIVRQSSTAELPIGVLGGLIGGLTATPGAIPVLYCDLAGLDKRAQRTRVQPFILLMQSYALVTLSLGPGVNPLVWNLYPTSLPAIFTGAIAGLYLYGRIPEHRFRRVVLILLIASGVAVLSNSHALKPASATAGILY